MNGTKTQDFEVLSDDEGRKPSPTRPKKDGDQVICDLDDSKKSPSPGIQKGKQDSADKSAAQIARLSAELEQKNKEIAGLQEQLKKEAGRVKEFERTTETLKADLQLARSADASGKAKFDVEIERLRAELKKREENSNKLAANLRSLELDIAAKTQEVANSAVLLENKDRDLKSKDAQLKNKDTELAKAAVARSEAEKNLQAAIARFDESSKRVSQLVQANEQLEKGMVERNKRCEELTKKLEDVGKKYELSTKEYEAAKKELQNLSKLLDECDKSHREEVERLRKELSSKGGVDPAEIAKLTVKLEEIKKENLLLRQEGKDRAEHFAQTGLELLLVLTQLGGGLEKTFKTLLQAVKQAVDYRKLDIRDTIKPEWEKSKSYVRLQTIGTFFDQVLNLVKSTQKSLLACEGKFKDINVNASSGQEYKIHKAKSEFEDFMSGICVSLFEFEDIQQELDQLRK